MWCGAVGWWVVSVVACCDAFDLKKSEDHAGAPIVVSTEAGGQAREKTSKSEKKSRAASGTLAQVAVSLSLRSVGAPKDAPPPVRRCPKQQSSSAARPRKDGKGKRGKKKIGPCTVSSRSKQRASAGARRPHVAEARAGMAGAAGGGRLETGRLACGARRRLFSSFFSFFGAARNGRITAEMESEQNVWLLSIANVTMEKRPFHKFIQFCRDSAAVLPLGATWRNDVTGYDVTDYDVTMYDIISHYV